MKQITIFGKEFTVQNQESQIDNMELKEDTIIIESQSKQDKTLLDEYLRGLLYNKLCKIYDQIRQEEKTEILGNLDFEVVDKIDKKKERIAKLSGNKILIKINAVALPEEALQYVLAHEIAHTFTRRHTRKFWTVVEKISPNYKTASKTIKEFQERLLKLE